MSINRKRGSIALARSLCYQINGAADDSDDMDGGGYGSVDVAEILSAEIERLREALAQPEPDLIPQDKLFVCGQMGANITRVTAQSEQVDCPRCGHVCSQRPWVGLTDEEILSVVSRIGTADSNVNPLIVLSDARAIEAKLKGKNYDTARTQVG